MGCRCAYWWQLAAPASDLAGIVPDHTPAACLHPCRHSRSLVPFRSGGDAELGDVAQFYHLPWLSMRSLMWGAVYGRGPVDPELEKTPFMHDQDHPNALGHRCTCMQRSTRYYRWQPAQRQRALMPYMPAVAVPPADTSLI